MWKNGREENISEKKIEKFRKGKVRKKLGKGRV
jgi:hypothetical protein